jgi:Uncharacterised nucleotidyltransferase
VIAPEQELMRLLVSTGATRAARAPRLQTLAAAADGERLDQLARAQSLLPLVAARLQEAAPGLVPDVVRERAAGITQETRHWGVAVEVVTERLAAALERSGIPAIALKGPIMARELYGDPGLRVTSDIDLLVSRTDFTRAVEILSDQGYAAESIVNWTDGLPLFEATLQPTAPWSPIIDLHWRLHWSDDGFSADALARSVPPDGRTPRLLAPLDQLAALLMIYARDGFWGLRGAADVAAWWDRHGEDMPAGGLDARLAAHPALADSIVAAATVAERLVGVPAARTVPGRAARRRSTTRAIRLANWDGSVPPARMEAARLLADVLVSPPGLRRAAIARRAWPPATVVADTHDRWVRRGVPLGLLRVYYASDIFRRVVPGQIGLLWHSRGGRELCTLEG